MKTLIAAMMLIMTAAGCKQLAPRTNADYAIEHHCKYASRADIRGKTVVVDGHLMHSEAQGWSIFTCPDGPDVIVDDTDPHRGGLVTNEGK